MAGDLVVAGRILNIGESITGDVLAAGWHVSLQNRAEDDWIIVPAILFGMGAYGLWTYRHYMARTPQVTGG